MNPYSPRSITTTMLVAVSAAALLAATLPPAAMAHAPLESTSPEAGANLDEPPTEVVLVFGGELDPEESGFIVTDAEGSAVATGRVDLDVPDRNELRADVAIETAGVYTVTWTAVGRDGHQEEGAFSFGFAAEAEEIEAAAERDEPIDAAKAAAAAAAAEQPNTAVSRPASGPLSVVVGGALLLLAVAMGARTLARRNAAA